MALRASVLVSAARALGWSQAAAEIEEGSVVGVTLRRRVQAALGPIVRQIQDTPDARPATATDAYWVTALDRDRNRHAFLAGPFPSHGAALEQVPQVKLWLDKSFGHDMDATFAAVGTAFGPRSSIPVFLPGGTINPTWEARARTASGQAPYGEPPSGPTRPELTARDREVHAEYRAATLDMVKMAKLATRIPLRLARFGFLGFGAPTIEATAETYLLVGRDAQAACRLTFTSTRNRDDTFVLTLAVAENDTYTLQVSRLYQGSVPTDPAVLDRLGSFNIGPIRDDMYLDQASDPDVLLPESWLLGLLPSWRAQGLDVGMAVPPGSRALVSALLSGGLEVFLRSDQVRLRVPGGTWEDLEILKVPYLFPVTAKPASLRALVVQHVSRGDLDNQALILMREISSTPGQYTLESVTHTAVGWKLVSLWKEDSSFAKTWAKNLADQGHIARMRDQVGSLIPAPSPRPSTPVPNPKVPTPAPTPQTRSSRPPQPTRTYLSPHAKTPGTDDLYKVPVGSIAREGHLSIGATRAGKPDEARRYVAKVRPNRWRFLVLEAGPTAKEDRVYRAMTGLSVAQQKRIDRYLDEHPEIQDAYDLPPSTRQEIAGSAEEHEAFDAALTRFVSDRVSERTRWAPTRVGKADLAPAARLRLDSTVFSDDEVHELKPYLLIQGDGDAAEETLFRRYREATQLEAVSSDPSPVAPAADAWRDPDRFKDLPVLIGTTGKKKWRVRLGSLGDREVTTPEFVHGLGLLPDGPLLRGACSLAFFLVDNDAGIQGQKVHDLNAAISKVLFGRVEDPKIPLSTALQGGTLPTSLFIPLWSFYLGKADPGYVWWVRLVDDTQKKEDFLRVMAGSRPDDYHVEQGTWTGPEEAAAPHPVWHWRPSWWGSLGDRGYPTLRLTFMPTGVLLQEEADPQAVPTEEPRNKDLIYLLQTVVLNGGDTAVLAPMGSANSPEMRYLLDRGFLLPPLPRSPGRFRTTAAGDRALATGAGLPNAIGYNGKVLDHPLGWPAFQAELTFRYAVEARAALQDKTLDNEDRWFRTIELNKLAIRASELSGSSKFDAKEILAYALETQGMLQADSGAPAGAGSRSAEPTALDPVDFVRAVLAEEDGWKLDVFPQGQGGGDGTPHAILSWHGGELWSGQVHAPQVGRATNKPETPEAYRARTAAGIYSRLARTLHKAGETLPDHAIPMLGLNVQIDREPTRHVFPVPSVGSGAEDFPGAWRGRWGVINTRNNTAAGSYPSYVEARAAADLEVTRDQEWKAAVAQEKAKYPVLNVDPKDPKSGYIKRLSSYGSHSQFWEAPHVADIRQPHGHDVQVHVLGNRLTRSFADTRGSRHDLLLFTVDVQGLGDALVWRNTAEARKVKDALARSGIVPQEPTEAAPPSPRRSSGPLPIPPLVPATAELSTYGAEAAKGAPRGTVAYKFSDSPGMILAQPVLMGLGWSQDVRPRAHYQYMIPPGGKALGSRTIPIPVQVPTREAFEAWADQIIADRGRKSAEVTTESPAGQGLGVAHYAPEKVSRVSVRQLHYGDEPDDGTREVHTHTTPARVTWYFPGGDLSRSYPTEGTPTTHDATYTSVIRFERTPTARAPAGPAQVEQEGCFDTTLSVPGVGQVQVVCGAVGRRDTWANIITGSERYGWNGSRWARGQIPSQTILRAVREAGITVFPGPSS